MTAPEIVPNLTSVMRYLPPSARLVLRAIAVLAGLCTLSILTLPLLLCLLMLLFDNTARGLMIMLGDILRWFGSLLPAGGTLPPYRSLSLDPAAIALAAFLHMVPCLLGLLPILAAPERRASWILAVACWCVALPFIRQPPALILLPGIVAALLLAVDGDRRSDA